MENRASQSPGDSEVGLIEFVLAVSAALDAISPEVVGHHRRVAYVADAIARQVALPPDQRRDVFLAAALHDAGAFSVGERLGTLEFEMARPHGHALAGYHLLRSFPHFARAARLVRGHHVPWAGGRGEVWRGEPVPLGSQILHLADRASVLVRRPSDVADGGAGVRRVLTRARGALFVPELVQALVEASQADGFWEEALESRAHLETAELGRVEVSASDFRSLGRLFWQLVDFRSRFTATHSSGVVAVARRLAELCGMNGRDIGSVALAAGLHDLGKLAVPAEILEKERSLSPGEREVLRSHPALSRRILQGIRGLEEVSDWASDHHERLDGRGYPRGRRAAELPLGARIVAVADVFTALTEERPYRRGMSARETASVLRGMAGDGALDAAIVAVAERNGAECNEARRAAQDGAARRYLAFREPSGDIPPTWRESAA
jgi:HD-GYP domain-containing protein (c-di-GMP phosphodiesterase class II)